MAWTDAQASILFTLFYVLFCFCFVFQSKEFSSAGLSPENLLCLMGWLGHRQGEDGSGSEELKFLNYNIRKVWNIRNQKHLSLIVRYKKTAVNSQINLWFVFVLCRRLGQSLFMLVCHWYILLDIRILSSWMTRTK